MQTYLAADAEQEEHEEEEDGEERRDGHQAEGARVHHERQTRTCRQFAICFSFSLKCELFFSADH